jgi:hypothetical protein
MCAHEPQEAIMAIQLPPNSPVGPVLETRTYDGAERQVVAVGEPLRQAPTRAYGKRVLYVEDFRAVQPGLWNDGVGWAARDCDIMFNGRPTLRLDTGGQSNGGATNPNRTAITSGVVMKRRLHDGYRHRFGVEVWFRMTSLNLTSNTLFSLSIYNRNGTQAHHGRLWLDPNGNNQPMVGRILDGAATNALSGAVSSGTAVYTAVTTSVLQNGAGSHAWDVPSGRLDRAGGWHWVKMVVDFATNKYVSVQLDGEAAVDLSGYSLDVTDTTGFAGMHHSLEFSASTATRRFVNVANMIGTLED